MKRCCILVVLTVACLAANPASSSHIGVYFDAAASDCDLGVFPGPVTWYIFAVLGEDAAGAGILGFEFRQIGTPAGWFINWIPNPALCDLCLPQDPTVGVGLHFFTCQPGPAVLLFTASGFATTSPPTTCLSILPHSTPANPAFTCPLVTLCDAPTYTSLCVPGTSGVINGNCAIVSCTIAVEDRTWTGVKKLYQN